MLLDVARGEMTTPLCKRRWVDHSCVCNCFLRLTRFVVLTHRVSLGSSVILGEDERLSDVLAEHVRLPQRDLDRCTLSFRLLGLRLHQVGLIELCILFEPGLDDGIDLVVESRLVLLDAVGFAKEVLASRLPQLLPALLHFSSCLVGEERVLAICLRPGGLICS